MFTKQMALLKEKKQSKKMALNNLKTHRKNSKGYAHFLERQNEILKCYFKSKCKAKAVQILKFNGHAKT